MFATLRQRNFALLWTGQLISMLGDWVLIISLPFYIYQQTGSALATGAMFIVQVIPSLLLGSVAGIFVDRWDRRWTMLIADISRALILLPLLLVHSQQALWIVYSIAFAETAISLFSSPAEAALIPHLVDDDHLVAANALSSLGQELTRLIGPMVGGALFVFLGLHSVILVDSASYIFSGIMILLIALPKISTKVSTQPDHSAVAPAANLWREWLAGLRLIGKQRIVIIIFLVMSITMIGEGVGRGAFIPFLSKVAGGNALFFSLIVTAQGVGGVLGSLLLNRIEKVVQPLHLMALGGMVIGLDNAIAITFPIPPVFLPSVALTGIMVVFLFTVAYIYLQRSVDDEYRGRIFGAYSNTNNLLVLLGLAFASLWGDRIGLSTTMYLSALFYALAGVAALIMSRRDLMKGEAPEELYEAQSVYK